MPGKFLNIKTRDGRWLPEDTPIKFTVNDDMEVTSAHALVDGQKVELESLEYENFFNLDELMPKPEKGTWTLNL